MQFCCRSLLAKKKKGKHLSQISNVVLATNLGLFVAPETPTFTVQTSGDLL